MTTAVEIGTLIDRDPRIRGGRPKIAGTALNRDSFSGGVFEYFGRLQHLEEQLAAMIGCRVDVVAEPVRRKEFQQAIDQDRALAF